MVDSGAEDGGDTPSAAVVPRWVGLADATALIALAVAFAVWLGGGFVAAPAGLSISVTEPVRPLLLAVVLLLTRHVAVRHPSLPTRLRGFGRQLTSTDAWRAAWAPFLVTRCGLVVVGLLAVYTIGYPGGEPPLRISPSELVNLPMRWDAGWYRNVARSGYHWNPREPDRQQNVAFFPAFPMMMRVVGRLFGGREPAFTLGGVALSCVFFLWALMRLYRLARAELGDGVAAGNSVLLLACYPFSVYYGAPYTESLFLLATLGAWLAFRDQRWGPAAAWGFLAGLTRPNGFLLAAALLALAWTQRVWRSTGTPLERVAALVAVAAPVAGAVAFSAYIGVLTGNPLQWVAQHAAWGRVYQGLFPLTESAGLAMQQGVEAYVAGRPYNVMNGAAVALALTSIIPVYRRLGLAAAVFVATVVLPPLFAGGVMSMGRLTSTLFPMFIWLATLTRGATMLVAVAFALLQAFAAVLFYTWRPLV